MGQVQANKTELNSEIVILCQQELSAVDGTNDNQVQYINERHTVPIGGKSVMNDQFSLFSTKYLSRSIITD